MAEESLEKKVLALVGTRSLQECLDAGLHPYGTFVDSDYFDYESFSYVNTYQCLLCHECFMKKPSATARDTGLLYDDEKVYEIIPERLQERKE